MNKRRKHYMPDCMAYAEYSDQHAAPKVRVYIRHAFRRRDSSCLSASNTGGSAG